MTNLQIIEITGNHTRSELGAPGVPIKAVTISDCHGL